MLRLQARQLPLALTRPGGAPSRGSSHSRVPDSIQRGRPFSMTIVTWPKPTLRAIRSTSLTTLVIISLSMTRL
jgi:hypothetical protein